MPHKLNSVFGFAGYQTGGAFNASDPAYQYECFLPVIGPMDDWQVEWELPVGMMIVDASVKLPSGVVVPLTFGGKPAGSRPVRAAAEAGSGNCSPVSFFEAALLLLTAAGLFAVCLCLCLCLRELRWIRTGKADVFWQLTEERRAAKDKAARRKTI